MIHSAPKDEIIWKVFVKYLYFFFGWDLSAQVTSGL